MSFRHTKQTSKNGVEVLLSASTLLLVVKAENLYWNTYTICGEANTHLLEFLKAI